MTYRETCEGCAKRDAEIASLRAEVKNASKGPRWVIDLSDSGGGILFVLWLALTTIDVCAWIFHGATPTIARAAVVSVVLLVALIIAFRREARGDV